MNKALQNGAWHIVSTIHLTNFTVIDNNFNNIIKKNLYSIWFQVLNIRIHLKYLFFIV